MCWRPIFLHVQGPDHCREAVRRRRHRARYRRLHQAAGFLRKRPLCAVLGGRSPARAEGARVARRQARQVDLHAPAGHSAALRAGADRKERVASQGPAQAPQAQGRRRTDQRLRRRARGRAHIPLHRAGGEGAPAGAPFVAAVDDASVDPRGLRVAAQRRRDAAAGRRRAQPLGGRLAGRHQRHARDDGLQQQGRRLLPDDRRPRADADAGDRRRARGQDPPLCISQLLGSARQVRRQGGTVRGALVRRGLQEARRCRRARRAPVGRGESGCDRGRVHRPAGRGHGGVETEHAAVTAALRPDVAAARGQQQVRFLRQDNAVDRAGPVREAQGADVSAYRRARAARGLPRRRRQDDAGTRRAVSVQGVRQTGAEEWLGAAEQAHLRQLEDLGPLRDHPDACRRPVTCPRSRPSSTTWSSSASSRCSFRPPSIS